MNIWAIIRVVRQIQPPPELADEVLFRRWFRDTSYKVEQIAREVGDEAMRAANIMQGVAKDDDLWSRCYQLLLDANRYTSATDRVAAVGFAADDQLGEETGTTLAEVMNLMETLRETAT